MDWRKRGDILRQYEHKCYQSAFYLLQQEEKAVYASLSALTESLHDEAFYACGREMQEEQVKRTVIRHSLVVKRKALGAPKQATLA
ncbi:hypothetical protein LJK88_04740 [Paenibacillus sp. P26]|nr:hypothetical protein LJK88_04740 [Paenibacillus sp. P26]